MFCWLSMYLKYVHLPYHLASPLYLSVDSLYLFSKIIVLMANELEVIRGLFIQQQKYIQIACDTEKDEGSSLKIFIMHAYIYQTEWMTDEFIFCSHNNKPKDHSIVQCTTQFIKVRVKCVNIVNCMHFTQYVIQWHLFMIISHLWLCNIPCTIHQLPFMNSQVLWAHIPNNLTRGSHLWKLDELKVWYREKYQHMGIPADKSLFIPNANYYSKFDMRRIVF